MSRPSSSCPERAGPSPSSFSRSAAQLADESATPAPPAARLTGVNERSRSRRGGAGRRLGLATMVTAVVVAILCLLAPSSSAAPLLPPQTRVAAIEHPASQLVGPHETVLPGGSRPRAPSYDQDATGSSVAAEGGVGGGSGPWAEGIPSEPGGAVGQTTSGSCVSACGEMLSGGSVTQQELLDQIGEWSNPQSLARALGDGWKGGGFASAEDALAAADQGPMGAELRVPLESGHMVVTTPVGDGEFRIRGMAVRRIG